ncbi:hypothetical protein FBX97_2426 [Herbaspirillum sp. SJZ107]|nr:hypothetical protein FBX97_2426 [Herbaspirillum sp. SJZ107]
MAAALDDREITGRAGTHVLQSWQPRLAAQPAALDAFLPAEASAGGRREVLAEILNQEIDERSRPRRLVPALQVIDEQIR